MSKIVIKYDIDDKVFFLNKHIIIKAKIEHFEIFDDNSVHYWVHGLLLEDKYLMDTIEEAIIKREEYLEK